MSDIPVGRWLFLCFLLVTAGCTNILSPAPLPDTKPPAGLVTGNQPPGQPKLRLVVTMRSAEEAYVAVEFSAESTDAENDKVAYTFEWFRNGEPVSFPKTQTDTVSKLGPDTNPDPFAVNASDVTWKVIATPRDPYGIGKAVEATTHFVLTRGCEPYPAGYILVDCGSVYDFDMPLGQAITATTTEERTLALQNAIDQHILGADGTPGHSRFRNYVDLLFKKSQNPKQTFSFDPNTYQYAGDPNDLKIIQLIDRTCLDVPLVGAVCLNEFIADVQNETGFQVIDFGPVSEGRNRPWGQPVTEASPSENGAVTIAGLGTSFFEVVITLKNSQVDLLFEPPTDSTLFDISDSSVNYSPELDLSTYMKAYGTVGLGEAFKLVFRVEVPASFNRLNFKLRTFNVPHSDFQMIYQKGPYCNNNLGTTENFRTNLLERPFDSAGSPMYSGLVSDTVSGVQGDDAITQYYAWESWPYPHTTSSQHGGSGVGRDRIGARSVAYASDLNLGFSDNPNNCLRPADACTLNLGAHGVVQHGSPDFVGLSAACEGNGSLGQISNNSDDATYKISEQVINIIPYTQGLGQLRFKEVLKYPE